MQNHQVLVDKPAFTLTKTEVIFATCRCILMITYTSALTIDLAMAFDGVIVLFENKNLVFLGTSTENGFDPLPFATGTCEQR